MPKTVGLRLLLCLSTVSKLRNKKDLLQVFFSSLPMMIIHTQQISGIKKPLNAVYFI